MLLEAGANKATRLKKGWKVLKVEDSKGVFFVFGKGKRKDEILPYPIVIHIVYVIYIYIYSHIYASYVCINHIGPYIYIENTFISIHYDSRMLC